MFIKNNILTIAGRHLKFAKKIIIQTVVCFQLLNALCFRCFPVLQFWYNFITYLSTQVLSSSKNFILQCLKYNLQFIKGLSHWHWSRHFWGLAVGRNLTTQRKCPSLTWGPHTMSHADAGHWIWVVWMGIQNIYYSQSQTISSIQLWRNKLLAHIIYILSL